MVLSIHRISSPPLTNFVIITVLSFPVMWTFASCKYGDFSHHHHPSHMTWMWHEHKGAEWHHLNVKTEVNAFSIFLQISYPKLGEKNNVKAEGCWQICSQINEVCWCPDWCTHAELLMRWHGGSAVSAVAARQDGCGFPLAGWSLYMGSIHIHPVHAEIGVVVTTCGWRINGKLTF